MRGVADGALDRREFIGAAGAAICATVLPAPAAFGVASSGDPGWTSGLLDDWTIDDMWGVYARYSEAIPYGRPHRTETLRVVAAVDADFVSLG
jgi:hypothetical protein